MNQSNGTKKRFAHCLHFANSDVNFLQLSSPCAKEPRENRTQDTLATWCKGTAQLSIVTELKWFYFKVYSFDKPGTDDTTDNPTNNSLRAYANCSNRNAALDIFSESDEHLLLTFSTSGGDGAAPMAALSCAVSLTSQAGKNISAVLLEHSPCVDGVFVLLWDNVTHRRWDVCSTWHAPGPAFMTSSNEVEIIVELNDATDPCDFNVSAMAVVNSPKRKLEVRSLSATEGKVCNHVGGLWSATESKVCNHVGRLVRSVHVAWSMA